MAERGTSWRANHITSGLRAVGGRLSVEGDRLVFRPHAFDRLLRAREWSAPLAEINVEVTDRDPKSHAFGAGLRRQLAVLTAGEEQRFIVNGVEDVAAALQAQLR